MNLFGRSLLNKLVAVLLAASLGPILAIGVLSYISARNSMRQQFLDHYTSIAQSKEDAIVLLLKLRTQQVEILSTNEIVVNLIDLRNKAEGRAAGGDDAFLQETLRLEAENFIAEELPRFSNITPFYEYVFIGQNGIVYFSTDRSLVGQDFSREEAFLRGREGSFVTDVTLDPKREIPSIGVAAPVYPRSGEKTAMGVVLAKMETDTLDHITSQVEGMGESGELYIVNRDRFMVTEVKGVENAVLDQLVETEPVLAFEQDQRTMAGIYTNYVGEPIVGVSVGRKLDQEFDLGWVLLAEIDVREAFAPVREMGVFTALLGIVMTGAVMLFAFFMARRIANPIQAISETIARVAEGDLRVQVPEIDADDEVGALAVSVRNMVESQRKLTRQIQRGIKVLASSSSEISSTTSQLASITTETATAVTETATTVEEIKQTAQVSNETARHVSESSQKAVQISQTGKLATEDTVDGITRIKAQMDSIAESIIRLNEQSQAIGEIISSVDDLAEQSNLLAVNAAIEAAKAGEQGKGFAVVAQEIKNLAMQSKHSTEQVRTILNDIQKATSASVAATEQGSKAVESGVSQSSAAGESIVALANTIDDSAQAAMQIAASSHEQLVGMDQVAAAMESINEATAQNVKSVKVLEVSAGKLYDLGQRLIALVEQYKV